MHTCASDRIRVTLQSLCSVPKLRNTWDEEEEMNEWITKGAMWTLSERILFTTGTGIGQTFPIQSGVPPFRVVLSLVVIEEGGRVTSGCSRLGRSNVGGGKGRCSAVLNQHWCLLLLFVLNQHWFFFIIICHFKLIY